MKAKGRWAPVSYSGANRVEEVLAVTCDLFGVTVADLVGPSQRRPLCHHRQVAMAALRELDGLSHSAIGSVFGRCHETVWHACQRVDHDETLRAMCDRILARVAGGDGRLSPEAEVAQLRTEVAALRDEVARLSVPERVRIGA